jgi:LAGLIDADG endonuclease
MLQEINVYFNNIGSIITSPDKSTITLNIRGFKNCLIVRDHFLSFPLLTYKLVYFTVWSKILDLMKSKDHLTFFGLLKIVSLKALFSKRLSTLLLSNFSNYITVEAPHYKPELNLINIH